MKHIVQLLCAIVAMSFTSGCATMNGAALLQEHRQRGIQNEDYVLDLLPGQLGDVDLPLFGSRNILGLPTPNDKRPKLHFDTTRSSPKKPVSIAGNNGEVSSLTACALAIDAQGNFVEYTLAVGLGTIYEFKGKVRLFGCTFMQEGRAPFVFLVFAPTDNAPARQLLYLSGRGRVIATDGKQTELPRPPKKGAQGAR
jgi:hypothetical protein